MPRKATGETYSWDNAKERKLLEKLDEYLSYSGGKWPSVEVYDRWAAEFNSEFSGVPAHGLTLSQKKERMNKVYRGWKALQVQTGLGYDPVTDRVTCSDDAWKSFIHVHKECKQLRYEGLRNKELYYNVFEKKHAAGTFGYGSVTMPGDTNPFAEELLSMDTSGTDRVPDEVLTPTNRSRHADNLRPADEAGSSRARGSAGKRRQRDATDEMTYVAMQEVVSHLRSRSHSRTSTDQSNETDHLLMCMNCMTAMGIPPHERALMYHHFLANRQSQRTFHRLTDDDRRCIINTIVRPQSPPAN